MRPPSTLDADSEMSVVKVSLLIANCSGPVSIATDMSQLKSVIQNIWKFVLFNSAFHITQLSFTFLALYETLVLAVSEDKSGCAPDGSHYL